MSFSLKTVHMHFMCLTLRVELIVSLCFFPSHQDPKQLFQACIDGDLEAVLECLEAGVGVDVEDSVRLSVFVFVGGFRYGSIFTCDFFF